jgi:hypothetical protein
MKGATMRVETCGTAVAVWVVHSSLAGEVSCMILEEKDHE